MFCSILLLFWIIFSIIIHILNIFVFEYVRLILNQRERDTATNSQSLKIGNN